MVRKFKEGLVFGAGFAVSFLLLWYMAAYWVTPAITTSRIEKINQDFVKKQSSSGAENAPKITDYGQEKPFHEMPIEDQIKASSVIALARYEKAADGKMRAIIKEFLKKDSEVTIYYGIGDEYASSSYYPKENTGYGDGVIVFFMGSPAQMRMSMTFSGGRIGGLGDLPLILFKKKCAESDA
jgi:hypothetical protein